MSDLAHQAQGLYDQPAPETPAIPDDDKHYIVEQGWDDRYRRWTTVNDFDSLDEAKAFAVEQRQRKDDHKEPDLEYIILYEVKDIDF